MGNVTDQVAVPLLLTGRLAATCVPVLAPVADTLIVPVGTDGVVGITAIANCVAVPMFTAGVEAVTEVVVVALLTVMVKLLFTAASAG